MLFYSPYFVFPTAVLHPYLGNSVRWGGGTGAGCVFKIRFLGVLHQLAQNNL